MSGSGASASQGSLGVVTCILSGASRGFGRVLAAELCAGILPGSELLLVSRTESDLRGLAEELSRRHPGITVRWQSADLSSEHGLTGVLTAARGLQDHNRAERLLIINNAGSLGDISKFFTDFTDPHEVNTYLFFNVSSALCLTSSLLKTFQHRPGLHRIVVNVSSLAALQPFKSWSLYCAGKAARDMMFRVLAAEEADIRVLNYAPGPLDTEMQKLARTKTADPDLRQCFIDMKNNGKLIDCKVSARKLLEILQADSYESGTHIDFYDKV